MPVNNPPAFPVNAHWPKYAAEAKKKLEKELKEYFLSKKCARCGLKEHTTEECPLNK